MKKHIVILTLALIGFTSAFAAELGMPAAPLKISEWIKGQPVDLAELKGEKVAVVEFWATWCPPCRTSIPHLTELQKKFTNAVFVGISDEKPDAVKKFVTKMGEKMDYVVALDKDDQTFNGYMKMFGIDGIPHAFIVDKAGRMVWQGHPMDGLEEALGQVIAGKYDLEAAQARAKKEAEEAARLEVWQNKLQALARLISNGEDNEESKKLEAELIALDKEMDSVPGRPKFDPMEFRKRVLFTDKLKKYQMAYLNAAGTGTLAQLETELKTDAPEDFDLAEFKQMLDARQDEMKAGPVLEAYVEAVGENGDADKAAELAQKIEALELKNPELLNQVAWFILTEDTVKHRDLKLATNLARRSVELSQSKDASALDTYARALFDSGNAAEAVAQQEKAIAATSDEEEKKGLAETLKRYYQAKAEAAPKAE